MKVTLEKVIQSSQVLGGILNYKMKATTAFKFRSIMKFVEEHLDSFNKTKEGIIKTFGIITDDNGKLIIPKGKNTVVQNEFDSLLAMELEFDPTLTLEDLDAIDVTPNELDVIMWMIKE